MTHNTTENIEEKIDRLYEEKIIKQRREKTTYKDYEPTRLKNIGAYISNLDVNNSENQEQTLFLKNIHEALTEPSSKNKKTRIKHIRKKHSSKTNRIIKWQKKRNLGKPVYLEETGEKIGFIQSLIYNENSDEIIGYDVKDEDSNTSLRIPIDQFIEDKRGLILTPRWYIDTVKTIERIEFKERVTPELTYLPSSKISDDDKNSFLMSIDPEIIHYIKEGKRLRKTLLFNLHVYNEQREQLNNELLDIIKKRVVEDINRRVFSEEVMDKRRRIKILDNLIKRCTDLLNRLDSTIIGRLSKEEYIAKKSDKTDDIKQSCKTESEDKNDNLTNNEIKQYSKPASLHHKQESLTSMIAELLEDKILEDIKKQLIKNQLSSYDRINAYGEMQRQEDDKDAYIKMLENELKQKRETIKHLQEELTRIIK